MKSLKECLHTLVRCAGGDGNLLFNVGPMPAGEIEPRQVARLKEMGAWLKKNGESIYGTRGGPYKPAKWGVSTCKGNTIYLHVLAWDAGMVTLPPIPKKIVKSTLLTGGVATVKQTDSGLEIAAVPGDQQEIDTIVVLELDGPAGEIPVLSGRMPSKSLASRKPAKASNVFQNSAEHAADKAFDDDEQTRWATDRGTHAAWLEVDLGAAQTIGRAFISEEYAPRAEEFELQYRAGADWKTFARGTQIGPELSLAFTPVTARVIRLNILKATEGPTISEFHLLPP